MPPEGPAWRAAYLAALSRTGVQKQAAAEAGVSEVTVMRHRDKDPAFAAAAGQAARKGREAAGIASRTWQEDCAARDRIVFALRSGMNFKESVQAAGVPRSTARTWRRKYPDWDLLVVREAEAGGTALSRFALPCPGPRCGTPAGYDYGCFRQACRDAKSQQVMEGRSRRKGRDLAAGR